MWKPGKRKILPKGIPLNRANFRQYIKFLQETFPSTSLKDIANHAGMKRDRLAALYYSERNKTIRHQEVEAFSKVYEDLKSSKKSYRPRVHLDKDNFRQFIDFLKETFPGLTQKSIAELANMQFGRLSKLLLCKKKGKYIRPEEIISLFQLYEDLKSGKVIYISDQRRSTKKNKF